MHVGTIQGVIDRIGPDGKFTIAYEFNGRWTVSANYGGGDVLSVGDEGPTPTTTASA